VDVRIPIEEKEKNSKLKQLLMAEWQAHSPDRGQTGRSDFDNYLLRGIRKALREQEKV